MSGVRGKGLSEPPPVLDRIRHLGNAPGRYIIEKLTCAQERRVSAFACRIQRISPVSMTLAAPVSGETDDWVTSYFTDFGMLRGRVSRRLGFGFVLDLEMSAQEREKLAAKVIWAEQHRNYQVPDNRRHKRVIPRSPQSSLLLQDGTRISCFIIDMSPSGVAVSADCELPLGTVLAVGTAIGRVVRHLEIGFAVQFIKPVDAEVMEERLAPPSDEVVLV